MMNFVHFKGNTKFLIQNGMIGINTNLQVSRLAVSDLSQTVFLVSSWGIQGTKRYLVGLFWIFLCPHTSSTYHCCKKVHIKTNTMDYKNWLKPFEVWMNSFGNLRHKALQWNNWTTIFSNSDNIDFSKKLSRCLTCVCLSRVKAETLKICCWILTWYVMQGMQTDFIAFKLSQQNSYSVSYLLGTVTGLWLDSNCNCVTVDNCRQSGDYTAIHWQLSHRGSAGSFQ